MTQAPARNGSSAANGGHTTANEPPPQTQELTPPAEQATPPAPPSASEYMIEFLVDIDGYHALIRGEHLTPTDVLAWTKRTIAGFKQQGFVNVRRDVVVNVAAPPAPPAPRPAPQRSVQAESAEEFDQRQPARPQQRQQGGGGGYQRGGQQRSGGGGQRQQGGRGGAESYHGEIYQFCPECGGPIYDNREKKRRDGWKGPFFACKDRDDCGVVVWKGDGSY